MNETLVTIGLCFTLVGSAVAAQPPVDPCTTKTITCPEPSSTNYWVQINLEPDTSSVCRFNPRLIDDLEIDLGGGVTWDFCNACSTNMEVEFSATSGPFSDFRIFLPPPQSSNLVSLQVGCKSYGTARGIDALREGDHKYTLKARISGAPSFPDEIDPRLEIDNSTLMVWLVRAGILALGLLGGFIGARIFTRQPGA